MSLRVLRKFKNGDITPQDYHVKHAFPLAAKCSVCGAHPHICILVYAEATEAGRRGLIPIATSEAAERAIRATMITLSDGGTEKLYFRAHKIYACAQHQTMAERVAAKAPSWCAVDIQRGPNPTNKVVFGLGTGTVYP